MSTTKRIIKIDATAIKDSACFLRLVLKAIHGYREEPLANDIVYGQAVHLFLENLEKSKDAERSIQLASRFFRSTPMKVKSKKEWLNSVHLTDTLLMLAERKKSEDVKTIVINGEPLVEKKFAIPLHDDEEVGILLCGTIDRLAKKDNGCFLVADYKTTSNWNPVEYFKDYKASPQLLTYLWAVNWHAKKYPDSIYAEMVKGYTGALIEGIFLANGKETRLELSEVFMFKEKQLEEYENLLGRLVSKLVVYAKQLNKNPDELPPCEGMFNGACKTPYGKCAFFYACTTGDREVFQGMLDNYFVKKTYDPLNFRA